ncbi:glycosyltransferase family 2 protein [Hymenobacter sp. BT507]|uniref:Glycosyltransferase family 2 protein n=1 Tax=Hymenobacter citatus TaxID=2763506 RepID=A0ABR7MGT3_9BACT|nr:glycosyltransferase [Hymenobacter citatus]MBC6610306.1 glycosyltransferase family 2 protein [Hymenobacter citatus]
MVRITIVIPTYKRPKFLAEAVTSCLQQTYPPYAILIGDDSPDTITQDVVTALQATTTIPIQYIHHQPPLRQAGNVNALMQRVQSEKLMLLHDDDALLPTALGTLAAEFERDPTIEVAYGQQYIITDDGEISYPRSVLFNEAFYRTTPYAGSTLTSLEAGMVQQFPNNAYVMNTALAQRVGYREVGDVCDFDFGFRVGQTGAKIHFVPTYTAKYRISNSAVSTGKQNDAGLASYLMVKEVPVPAQSALLKKKWLKSRAAVAVGQAIANKRFKTAIRIYFSEDHLSKIPTPGGIKRLLNILLLGHLPI